MAYWIDGRRKVIFVCNYCSFCLRVAGSLSNCGTNKTKLGDLEDVDSHYAFIWVKVCCKSSTFFFEGFKLFITSLFDFHRCLLSLFNFCKGGLFTVSTVFILSRDDSDLGCSGSVTKLCLCKIDFHSGILRFQSKWNYAPNKFAVLILSLLKPCSDS